jgi:hypothetical protein
MFKKAQLGASLALFSLATLPIQGAGMEQSPPPLPHQPLPHEHHEEAMGPEHLHPFTFLDGSGNEVAGYYYLKEVPCPANLHGEIKHHEGPTLHMATPGFIAEPHVQHATTTKPIEHHATITDPQHPQRAQIKPALPDIPEQVRIEGSATHIEGKPALQTAAPLVTEATNDQRLLQAGKAATESRPPLQTANPLVTEPTNDQRLLQAGKTAKEARPPLQTATPLVTEPTNDQRLLQAGKTAKAE